MHISFLFVDVKGSTLLKVDSTQERIKETFDAYHDLVESRFRQNGGRTVSITGDGLLGQFMNSDDAVGAALEIQGAMEQFNREKNKLFFPFYLRIGISCGDIQEREVSGKMTDLIVDTAAKTQQVCEPGHICVTIDVYNELERYKEFFSYEGYMQVLKIELYTNRPLPQWKGFSLGDATGNYNKGFDFLENAEYEAAEKEFRKALEQAETSGDPARISACIHGLAYSLGRQRKNRDKVRLSLRQIALERKLKRKKELKTAYRNICYAYYWLARDLERSGEFTEAMKFYRKMRVMSSLMKDERLLKEANRNLKDLRHFLDLKG